MWAFASWGLIGAATVRAIVLVEAIERVRGRPWRIGLGGPGGGMFLLAQVLHCGIGVGVAAAVGSALPSSAGPVALIGFGLGAAAPTTVKKLSGYSLALVPGKDETNRGSGHDAQQ
jgi:hypothetical protein